MSEVIEKSLTRHHMITGGQDSSEQILKQLDDAPLQREIQPGVVVSLEDPSEYGKYLQSG